MLKGNEQGRNADRRLFFFINFAAFVLMFALTYITPLYADDLGNQYIGATGRQVLNLADVAESVSIYYFTWGGRAIAQFLIQFFLLFDKIFYNLMNAAVYVALACVMYKYIAPARKWNNLTLLFIYLMLWFFIPTFGGEVLWLTGSITYLWELLIVLCFGMIYYRKYKSADKEGSVSAQRRKSLFPAAVGMFLFGVFAGLSIEATSCMLMLALFSFVVWNVRGKRRILLPELTGILGGVRAFAS